MLLTFCFKELTVADEPSVISIISFLSSMLFGCVKSCLDFMVSGSYTATRLVVLFLWRSLDGLRHFDWWVGALLLERIISKIRGKYRCLLIDWSQFPFRCDEKTISLVTKFFIFYSCNRLIWRAVISVYTIFGAPRIWNFKKPFLNQRRGKPKQLKNQNLGWKWKI